MFFWPCLNKFHLALIADPIGLFQNGVAGKMKKDPVMIMLAPSWADVKIAGSFIFFCLIKHCISREESVYWEHDKLFGITPINNRNFP